MKLWAGRFQKETDTLVNDFNSSIGFDARLYRQDITGSIAHACADTRQPVQQGFFGIFEVFMDTILICTLTALVILCSGVPVAYGQAAGAELTIAGFEATYGSWVSIFTAVALCCFAFSTILGWDFTARAVWNFCFPHG